MEYKFYKILRNKIKLPAFLRRFFSVFILFIGFIFVILPVFPGSIFPGVFLLSIGIILVIKVDKLRHLIKLRRSIIYLFSNIFKKETRKQKIKDIKKHLGNIFKEK